MKTNQKGDITIVLAVIIAIVCIGIGVQAYSNTLNFKAKCEYLGGVALSGDMLGNCYKDGQFIKVD